MLVEQSQVVVLIYLIIDDPHKEQDIKKDSKSFEKAWNWYTSGPRQRLQPGGRIVVVMTRWSTKDITGQLLRAQGEENSDQWEVVELPALLPDGKACLARILDQGRIRKNQSIYSS